MLQQTQVAQVIPYYSRFLKRFPTLKKLAKASLEEVYLLWQGLGYYRRARMLHEAAVLMNTLHQGKIPHEYDLLRKLPGFGEYTTGAVLSLAYHKPYPAIDGNVNRVISRIFAIRDFVGSTSFRKQVKDRVMDHLAVNDPASFNQALMELGSLVCQPKKPQCNRCPVSRHCTAFSTLSDPNMLPLKKSKKKKPHYAIAIGILLKGARVLIARRAANELLGNLWEFPGGKKKHREKLSDTCRRELKNKMNIDAVVSRPLIHYRHTYSHLDVTLHFFMSQYVKGRVKLKKHTQFKWVKVSELKRFAFASGHKKAIAELKLLKL